MKTSRGPIVVRKYFPSGREMFNLNHSDGEEARAMNQMVNDDSYDVDQMKRLSSCLLFLTSVTSSILTMKPDTF
jgi:hypothetical protein